MFDGINTKDGIVQKKIIDGGLVSASINVDEETLERIYHILRNIDVTNYSQNFNPPYKENDENITKTVTPSNIYELWIWYGENEYSIYWHDKNESVTEDAKVLRGAFEEIIMVIRSLDEYKDLGKTMGEDDKY